MTTRYPFEPDYAVPPGATLREVLEDRGMSQSELAKRTELAEKTISQIVNGVAPVSVETARKLELVLDVPAGFWNRRELSYREALARLEESEKLAADITWLKEIPVTILIERKRIEATGDKALLVHRALKFFGVSSVDAWRVMVDRPAISFRGKSAHNRKPGMVAAWRRLGVLQSRELDTQPFDSEEFKKALKAARRMVTKPASIWHAEMPDLFASAGVAVVLTKEIPGAAVSGIARWLTPEKALIQLSLKHKTEDQLWFTFFHEAGHLLKHGKKRVFVDLGFSNECEEEREANEFARDILIPRSQSDRLPYIKHSAKQILDFAKEVGVTPGIVVGRLQRDKLLLPSAFNKLKTRLEWSQR